MSYSGLTNRFLPFVRRHNAIRPLKIVVAIAAVVSLLAFHCWLALDGLSEKSATFDEHIHISGGVSYWFGNDYCLNAESGNIVQRWLALPVLFDRNINIPDFTDHYLNYKSRWVTASTLFYDFDNNPERILFRCRCMTLALSLILALVVFFWSKRIFGLSGGFFSLILYVLSPTILANARLTTVDLAMSLMFLVSTGLIWRLFRRFSISRLLAASCVIGIAFLTKMSACLLVPVYIGLLCVWYCFRKPLPEEDFPSILASGFKKQCINIVVIAGMIFCMIWVAYGLRYSMFSESSSAKVIFVEKHWNNVLNDHHDLTTECVRFAKKNRLLPEAFLYGFIYAVQQSNFRNAYLNGEYRSTGWWYFFPYTFLVKTPLPIILVILVSFCALFKNNWSHKRDKRLLKRDLRLLSPLCVLFFIYAAFAISKNLNIGHRHILVLYPVLFVFSGLIGRQIFKKNRIITIFASLAIAWLVWETISIKPHYLAYFNQVIGGSKNAYRHLVDSSLDWGQDLNGLEKWLRENRANSKHLVYISYFGSARIINIEPNWRIFYRHITQPDQKQLYELGAGTYCVSATMLSMVYFPGIAAWNSANEFRYQTLKHELIPLFSAMKDQKKFLELINEKGRSHWIKRYREFEMMRLAKLCEFLRRRKPDHHIGYSILIYNLSPQDIKKAL